MYNSSVESKTVANINNVRKNKHRNTGNVNMVNSSGKIQAHFNHRSKGERN